MRFPRLVAAIGSLLFVALAHPQVSITAERISDKPLLSPSAEWSSTGLFNPTAVSRNGKVTLFFRATDKNMTSRIGMATSADTKSFLASADPVLQAEAEYERNGGVEDPRIVFINGTYYLTYTAYNRKDAQLCLATSRDLQHWDRKGVIMPAYVGAWNTGWTKSGAILPQKVNGLWWMYYLGTRTDPDGKARDYMGVANSSDLEHWKDASALPVLTRRPDAFDSRVMEPGPSPIMTSAGILLLYNGANDALVYGPAWVLFDRNDPTKLLARADKPFVLPELDWEKNGVVPNVIFLEGAIFEKEKKGAIEATAYYGAADKFIGGMRLHIRLQPQQK